MKRLAFCLLVSIVLGLIMGGPVAGKDKKVARIRIGAVLTLSGELAQYGELQKNAYQMALEYINETGLIKGKKLELLIEDDRSDREVAQSAAKKLISQENVLALTGGYSSAVAYAMAEVAQQHRIPYCAHTGAADDITERRWNYVFRINQPASEYFNGLLSFMKQVARPKTVAIVHENTLFGQSQSKSFAQACQKQGCKVVLMEGFPQGATDFKPLLVKIRGLKPDLLYAISYVKDAALMAIQCKEFNLRPKLFVGGGGGFSLSEFPKNAGVSAELIYCATLWSEHLPFPGARRFYEDYVKRFGSPPHFQGAQAYVALFVLADAISRARDITAEGIREALTYTDMQSMYGPIKFISYGKKTQQNSLPTYVGQWQDNNFELVWPREYASKPYVYPLPPWPR